MTMFAGEKLRLRCPKCKGADFHLVEAFEELVFFSVKGGVMPKQADDHQAGPVIGMHANCDSCKHGWRPRGASISDLIDTGASHG